MNNNLECFFPLRDALASHGHEVVLLTLPNHGDERSEVDNFEEGLKLFNEKMKVLVDGPYHAVAFSLGALYLENWLATHSDQKPVSYVLLAPAIAVNYEGIIRPFFKNLPRTYFILSQMPRIFRRYNKLFFWEYALLLDGIEHLRGKERMSKPNLVLIDPKDELVNAKKVISSYSFRGVKIEKIQRKNLKRSLGRHHIIFHPDYFNPDEWQGLLSLIKSSFNSAA